MLILFSFVDASLVIVSWYRSAESREGRVQSLRVSHDSRYRPRGSPEFSFHMHRQDDVQCTL